MFVNRWAIIVKAKQPYVDWANSIDDDGPTTTLEIARSTPTIFLVHEHEGASLFELIDEWYWEAIFDLELVSWMRDISTWPDNHRRGNLVVVQAISRMQDDRSTLRQTHSDAPSALERFEFGTVRRTQHDWDRSSHAVRYADLRDRLRDFWRGPLERDPLGSVDGVLLYKYGRSNPQSDIDPTGLHSLRKYLERYRAACDEQMDQCLKKMRERHPRLGRGEVLPCAATRDQCYRRAELRAFEDWYTSESHSLGWVSLLPACPCNITIRINRKPIPDVIPSTHPVPEPVNPNPAVWKDPNPWKFGYHPGASWCMRSKPTSGGTGQQCCYDSDGKLITHGPGAGTPDRGSPGGGHHIPWDVKPYDLAKDLDERCGCSIYREMYCEVRPVSGRGRCPKNPPGDGDPYYQ